MSPTALFIIGVVIFAITVYGVVMAGGLTLSRRELEENDYLAARVDDDALASTATVPITTEY